MAYQYNPYFTTPYLWPYYQQPLVTPFIPPSASLPASPSGGAGQRRVRFEDDEDHDVYRPGRRPPSWHAGMAGTAPAPNGAPFPSPPFVYAALPTVMPPQYPLHRRRQSDTALQQPAWIYPTWMVYPQVPAVQQQPRHTIHPLLNGEHSDGPLLLFDLSSSLFQPVRTTSHSATSGLPLSQDELSQTATYPSATRMIITCDELPDWRVTLEPQNSSHDNRFLAVPHGGNNGSTAPITVYDVLFSVHRMLQRQVTHREWYDLSQTESTAVARAYTRRCRAVPNTRAFEESQGIRRVDYLKDKFMFKGLVRRAGEPGFEHVKLLVGRAR